MGVSDQRHASAALYPLERTQFTHWIARLVGPGKAWQGLVWTKRLKEKFLSLPGMKAQSFSL
jgi:hypothetical protein